MKIATIAIAKMLANTGLVTVAIIAPVIVPTAGVSTGVISGSGGAGIIGAGQSSGQFP